MQLVKRSEPKPPVSTRTEHEAMVSTVKRMSTRQQMVVALAVQEECSREEISIILDIPQDSVAVLLKSADAMIGDARAIWRRRGS